MLQKSKVRVTCHKSLFPCNYWSNRLFLFNRAVVWHFR